MPVSFATKTKPGTAPEEIVYFDPNEDVGVVEGCSVICLVNGRRITGKATSVRTTFRIEQPGGSVSVLIDSAHIGTKVIRALKIR